jgi:hypothetical protein
MTTYDLTANTKTSYDTFSNNDITLLNRIQNLENKVTSQGDKLDHIVKLLNELSEKKSTS